MLQDAMERLDMSARAYSRILKVARTIADLENGLDTTISTSSAATAPILTHHLQEALSYRSLDRGTWGATTTKLPFQK